MNDWIGGDLEDLALFGQVADQGGFTAAARRIGVPQSTISRRVAALEDRLGVKLLDRTTRRMRLTEAGQRAHDHVRRMLDEGSAARSAGHMFTAAPSGLLRIAAPVMLGRSTVPTTVRSYMRQYPEVSVGLEFTTRSLDPVEDDVDVVIRLDMPERSAARTDHLFRSRAGVFAPPSFAGTLPTTPHDIAGSELFGVVRGAARQSLFFTRAGAEIEVPVSLRLRCNDSGPVVAAAEACGGLALLPAFAAPSGWKAICPEWTLPYRDVLALTTRHGRELPRVAAFVEMLKADMAAMVENEP